MNTNTTLETKEINGKKIPVITHAPVGNGEASNNVGLKDMSPDTQVITMTLEEQKQQWRVMRQRLNRNVTELGGTVTSKRINKGSIVYEKDSNGKKTDAPRVDEFGNEVRYADTFYFTFDFTGGSKEYPVSEELYNSVTVGEEYLLKGRQGKVRSFGKEEFDTVWQSFEYI